MDGQGEGSCIFTGSSATRSILELTHDSLAASSDSVFGLARPTVRSQQADIACTKSYSMDFADTAFPGRAVDW